MNNEWKKAAKAADRLPIACLPSAEAHTGGCSLGLNERSAPLWRPKLIVREGSLRDALAESNQETLLAAFARATCSQAAAAAGET